MEYRIDNIEQFNVDYLKESPVNEKKKKNLCFGKFQKKLSHVKPYKLFSIIDWLITYDIRKCLINDLISGLTVGVMHIPQGLAYGSLTGLSPIYGLYTSFFPGLIYMLFGTSKHLSVGTFAIISLMVYSTIIRLESNYTFKESFTFNETNNSTSTSDNLLEIRLNISMSLAFACGLVQILFSILQIGSITKYLSNALLKGFTTAAAIHVATSQLSHLFGVNEPIKRQKYFQITNNYMTLIHNFKSINLVSLTISFVSITLLIVIRIHINERFKRQLRSIPVPTELIVIVVGTLLAYFLRLDTMYGLSVVGAVPVGLPTPRLPDFSLFFDVLPDAITIAILSFASSISAAELYAKKHNYKINPNKEFFALGISNAISSFFQCFTCSGALSRTALLESSGGKTQLVTGIASTVVLLVLLWIAPLFEKLPKACLGSIIIASLVNLLLQVKELPKFWKNDKIDFIVWMIAFISSLVMNVDSGFFISVVAVMFLNTYRSQKLNLIRLGYVQEKNVYVNIEKYKATEIDEIQIFKLSNSIFYINADKFKNLLQSKYPLTKLQSKPKCLTKCTRSITKSTLANNQEKSEAFIENNLEIKYKFIILDLSSVNHIDEFGVKILKELVTSYREQNVQILLTDLNDTLMEIMIKLNCFKEGFDTNSIFLCKNDAILYAKQKFKNKNSNP